MAKIKMVRQSELSAECFLVQIWGQDACHKCKVKGTVECGGQKILKTKKNEKGVKVGRHGIEAK